MSENRYGALTDAGADQAPAAILCASLLRSSERTTKYIPSPFSTVLHPGYTFAGPSLASWLWMLLRVHGLGLSRAMT